VFVVARCRPLFGARSITPRDLQAHTLITSNTPLPEALWFKKRVFGRKHPKLEFLRFPLTEAIIDATRVGMGIAIMSEWMAKGYLGAGDLVTRQLASGPLLRPWRLAYRRDVADAAERLIGALASSAPRLCPR
jgi:LysR family transcriptional regulator, regulator for metE and metH